MTTSLQDGTMVDKIAQFDLPKELAEAEQKKPWPSASTLKSCSRSMICASSSSPCRTPPT